MKRLHIILYSLLFILIILCILLYVFPNLIVNKAKLIKTSGDGVNNPGNIRSSTTPYTGKTTPQGNAFETFDTLNHGYRAMIELLRAYYKNHNLSNLNQMISRYAPSSDNNTPLQYAQTVADAIGVTPDQDMYNTLYSVSANDLVKAMSKVEQGNKWYLLNYLNIKSCDPYSIS